MERDTEEWLRPWRARDVDADVPARGVVADDRRPDRHAEPTDVREVRVGRRVSPTGLPPADAPTAAAAVAAAPPSFEPLRTAGVAVGDDGAHDDGRPGPAAGPVSTAGHGRLRAGVVGIVAGLVGAAVGTTATYSLVDGRPDGSSATTAGTATSASDRSDSGDRGQDARTAVVESPGPGPGDTVVSAVAEAVLPAVVRIDVFVTEDDDSLGTVDVAAGVGSGVVFSGDGYVLTNNHVVEDTDTVQVQLSDGSQLEAEVVGTDRLTDLAVLRIDAAGLTAVTLRTEEPLRVGETAIAIGSPFGLDASVTAGVVSAINRDLQVPADVSGDSYVIPATIQTDAAINPGNSGGALVDANGRLIGINTAIFSGSGGSQGVGFAIPTRTVIAAADQLIGRGFVSHPFLGITGLDVTSELARRYEDEHGLEIDGGAVVGDVVAGSGAAEAGLRPGDIIVDFGDQRINGMTDVIAAIASYDIGAEVAMSVLRDGQPVSLTVTLGERPREGG